MKKKTSAILARSREKRSRKDRNEAIRFKRGEIFEKEGKEREREKGSKRVRFGVTM